ncbi:MAG TPA: hypothetical protein VKX49_06680 [Bryobacteraceae bacterium]|nr:hypothetical protein [Bryobacteraceae bacterium]
MSVSPRERFLAALAKMLGENPQESGPLRNALVCENWLLSEILDAVFPSTGEFKLDREKLNRLLLNCERQMISEHFYSYFFSAVATLEDFEDAVERFRVRAMWLYGNFHFALKKLGTCDKHEFDKETRKTEPRSPADFEGRESFNDIESIPRDDLGLLGYVSGKQKIVDLEICVELLSLLHDEPARIAEILRSVGTEKQKKVSETLAEYEMPFPSSGVGDLDAAKLEGMLGRIKGLAESLRSRQQKAIEIGLRNTHRYLTLPHLDVYVATSMRTQEDYENQHAFIQLVFTNPVVKDLKLRYFDPTLSYADDRITKGLVEMLMLRRARVTIYTASRDDTLGKDSELAATLAQGKAVIAYVPPELDRKAELLRVDHPLGLQIDIKTGVAHGIIVVRSPEHCAKMLRKVLLRELAFTIRHEKGNFLLEETETHSVVRVVSDDPYLTHAFWTFFHHHDSV